MLRPSPIFTRENRQANRDGRKTQTRRIIKLDELYRDDGTLCWHYLTGAADGRYWRNMTDGEMCATAPHGKPGDVWYMREPLKAGEPSIVPGVGRYGCYADDNGIGPAARPWRWQRDTLSSMFMPRDFARDFKLVTDVRAQRVQDISDVDCKAEGTSDVEHGCLCSMDEFLAGVWLDDFCEEWDHINGKKPGCSSADNPWTFAYSYRTATPAEIEAAKEKK